MTPEELKNITPKLHKLQQLGSGFNVPENYFKNVETIVFSKISSEKLTNENPFNLPKDYFDTIEDKVFEKIKKEEQKPSFSVPDGYFDSIEDKVFEKINKPTKVIDFKTQFIKTFLPIAASASLLLLITLQFFNKTDNKDLFASMETSEIENWIENGDIELNSYEITAVYSESDLEELNLNQQFDEEDLTNYLENIDVESLILTN